MDPVPGLDLSVPPFDLLDDSGRARLLASVDMGFHPAGQILIEAGQPSPHVLVVLKGQLHAYDRDAVHGDQRFADYGPGDVFGAWAVMAGRARHSYRTDSDCLSFLIPADVFRQLLSDYPRFAAWFNEGLAVKGQLADQAKGSELAELMVTQVRDAQLAPAETVAASTSIADATLRLRDSRVDCLLVDDPQHAQPGIVTRTDLLEALALQQLPLLSPIGPLAKRPLVSVRSEDVLFQALVAMTERHIERVVVHDNGRIAGTLGMAEVLSHYASHSHLISLRLARADTLDDIADAAHGHAAAGAHPACAGRAHSLPDGTGERAQQPGHGAHFRTAVAGPRPRPGLPAGHGQRGPPRTAAEDRPGQCPGRRRWLRLAGTGGCDGWVQRCAGASGLSAVPGRGDGQPCALAHDRHWLATARPAVAPRIRTGRRHWICPSLWTHAPSRAMPRCSPPCRMN